MLSDLQVLYKSQGNEMLPFIVARVQGSQDSLILCPDAVGNGQKDFVNDLYKTMPNRIPDGIHLRIFSYGSRIVVAAIFPTTVPEPETGRLGGVIAFGGLIDRGVFLDYQEPSSSWLSVFLNQINTIFGTSVYRGGADAIQEMIDDTPQNPEFKRKVEQVLYPLLEFTFFTRRRKRGLSAASTSRIRPFETYPKAILFNQADGDALVRAFFSVVDSRLSSLSVQAVEVSNESFEGEASITMVPVAFPLSSAKGVSLMAGRGGKYIKVY